MTDTLSPIGFWSYARQDDEEKLSGLRSILQRQLQQKYGREPIKIFQDVAAIPPGADWNNKITEALHSSTFLIPIITPNFLESEWCNQEFFLFLEREQAIAAEFPELAASRRIFPIFYIDITDVEAFNEQLLPELRKRQWTNFRDLIYKEDTHESVRLRLDQIAESIVKVLRQDQRAAKERKIAEAASAAEQQTALQKAAESEGKRLKEHAKLQQHEEAERTAAEAAASKKKEDAEREAREAEARSLQEMTERKQREEKELLATPGASTERLSFISPEPQPSTSNSKSSATQEASASLSATTAHQPSAQHRASNSARQSLLNRNFSETPTTPKERAIAGLLAIVILVGLIFVTIYFRENPLGVTKLAQAREAFSSGDYAAAARIWQKSCESNGDESDEACESLAERYIDGKGVEQDPAKAAELFAKACTEKDYDGCFQLANLYASGQGVSKDIDKAIFFYGRACDGSQYGGAACNVLGLMYANGTGVPQDSGTAQNLFAKSCNNYSPEGCTYSEYLEYYHNKAAVPQDFKAMVAPYQKDCHGGNGAACGNLGNLYERGDGEARDTNLAVQFWQQGCALKNPASCIDLGNEYYQPDYDQPKDVEKAKAAFQRACKLGASTACDYLKAHFAS